MFGEQEIEPVWRSYPLSRLFMGSLLQSWKLAGPARHTHTSTAPPPPFAAPLRPL